MSWRKVKLGDVCIIEKGKVGITKAIPGDFPLVVLGKERRSHNEFHFDGKAVIIPLVSSTGHGHRSLKRIHYEEGKFAVGDILCAVIPKNYNELDSMFLYRYLDVNKEKELVGRMKGMANVSLPIKSLAEIEIPLPSIDEQQTIIGKLSTINNQTAPLTAELTRQLDFVKQLRQSFLREAMQGKLVPQDPKDEPASELLQKIKAEKEKLIKEKKLKKDKPLQEIKPEEIPFGIPENWAWCRLGETSNATNSSIVDGPFGSSINVYEDYIDFGVPVVRMVNVKPFKFLNDNLKFIKEERYLQLIRHNIKPGDVLLSKVGAGIGEACVFPYEYNDALLSTTGLARFRVGSLVLPEYLCAFLNVSQSKLKGLSQNTAQPFLNMTDIKNFLFPLPPLSEQHRIVAKLEQLMQHCDNLEQSIRQSKEQTNMLLQAALREALRGDEAEVPKG